MAESLCEMSYLRALFAKHNISARRSLGQNFIVNPGVAPKIVECSGIDGDCGVIEIGPGAGVLTQQLAAAAKRVVAVEIDAALLPVLAETLAAFNNTEVLCADAMKTDLRRVITEKLADCARVAVVGNLPYYITSPLVMKLLEDRLPVEFITAMVQKEAAVRFCAAPGARECGAVTYAVNYYSEPRQLFDVSPGSFYPPPQVTSTVMRLDLRREPPVAPRDEKRMFALIKAAFAQRRKTALNALSAGLGLEKPVVAAALAAAGLDAAVRGERLTLAQYAALSDLLAV